MISGVLEVAVRGMADGALDTTMGGAIGVLGGLVDLAALLALASPSPDAADPAAFAWTLRAVASLGVVVLVELIARALLILRILVRRTDRPDVALSWIVVLLTFPIGGILLYLLIGETRFGGRRIRQHARVVAEVERPGVRAAIEPELRPELPPLWRGISGLCHRIGRSPASRGNQLALFGDTRDVFERIVADIDAATGTCHLCFYIWLDDDTTRSVADALCRAAKRGVACRVLLDGVGSRPFLRSERRRTMEAAGVRVVEALPVNALRLLAARADLRNHRKIIVIDGQIAWTGSQNMADADFAPKPRYAPWIDCMLRIDGPAAKELQILFIEDWYLDTEELLADSLAHRPDARDGGVPVQVIGTGPNFYSAGANDLVQALCHVANEEIVLTTPYFVPDRATLAAIVVAARRGVHVTLVLPRRVDAPLVGLAARGFYGRLLDAGVHLREHAPGLLHAKTMTIDRDLALITSTNLDRRSFELNFEVGTVIYDSDFASSLRFLQTSYIEDARALDATEWHARGSARRMMETLAGMAAPLL